MMNKLTLAATAIAMTASGLAATPAAAQRYQDQSQNYAYDQAYRDGYNRQEYQDYRRDDRREYSDDRRYEQPRRYQDRRYYSQARNRCRGNSGTIIGAIAGGLLGNAIAGRGDRTLGTVLGAGGGALAGRAVERDGCR